MKKLSFSAVLCALALSACGGGSGGAASSTLDPIDKYLGTWKGACDTVDFVLQSSDDKPTSLTYNLKFTKLSATTANIELTVSVYGNADTTCQGAPIGRIVQTGLSDNTELSNASGITSSYGPNTWTYEDNVTLSGGQQVDQMTLISSKLSNASSSTLTAGPIKVDLSYFPAETTKNIAHFIDANTVILNSSTVADGYPTELVQNKYLTYIKQASLPD